MDKKKQLLLSIGLVLILVLMIVGISYAAFKFVGAGNKPNTITTGAITMEYTESTNTISMTGALPTTDATGKVRLTAGEYFDFTIKSSIQGNANINWEIAAEDITASSAKKMDGKNIKLYLTKLNGEKEEEVMAPKVYNASTSANTKTGRPSGVMSLATGTMSASETTNYRLRMYVDEDYNPQGDGGGLSFSVKINAYGKVKEAPTGSKMKAYVTQADLNKENFTLPQTDFHTDTYRSKITTIITKNDNIVPATATESWDISEAGDGSVMAYVEDDGSGNSTYKLTIGGKGGIIANESMIGYFGGFNKMTSIDLSALDTSEVTNMNDMFGMSKIKTIYVGSNFITNKVTSSTNMFKNSTSLAGGFGTKYNSSKIDKTYARIDSCATPGYFTDKNNSSLAGGTFETDSWATIISNVRSGQTCMYKVGDTKSVSVGTYGTHTVRISNMSTPSECRKSNFSQTACGFVLEFADIITSYKVNDTDTYKGGWPACKMRTFVNNNIYNALPSDLKSGIINTKVITGHGSADSQNLTSTDKLYLLSTAEVWENGTSNEIKYDTARDVTRQLDYYKQMGTTTNNYSAAAKKMNSGGYIWRLRTAWSFNPDSVYGVERSGDWYSRDPEYTGGVSPAFRIG